MPPLPEGSPTEAQTKRRSAQCSPFPQTNHRQTPTVVNKSKGGGGRQSSELRSSCFGSTPDGTISCVPALQFVAVFCSTFSCAHFFLIQHLLALSLTRSSRQGPKPRRSVRHTPHRLKRDGHSEDLFTARYMQMSVPTDQMGCNCRWPGMRHGGGGLRLFVIGLDETSQGSLIEALRIQGDDREPTRSIFDPPRLWRFTIPVAWQSLTYAFCTFTSTMSSSG